MTPQRTSRQERRFLTTFSIVVGGVFLMGMVVMNSGVLGHLFDPARQDVIERSTPPPPGQGFA